MKTRLALSAVFAGLTALGSAEVRINEVDLVNHRIELVNTGPGAVDMTGWWFCNRVNGSPFYAVVTTGATVNPLSTPGASMTNFLSGQTLVLDVTDEDFLPEALGEFSIYNTNSFGSSAAIVDYLSWNSAGVRDTVADAAGLWVTNATIDTTGIGAVETLQAVPGTAGNGPSEWFIGRPSMGTTNSLPLGPILHWPLEEGSGTTTEEVVSGESAVATFTGDPAWDGGVATGSSFSLELDGPLSPDWVDAGSLDNADNYVASLGTPSDAKVVSGGWAVTGWMHLAEDANTSTADHCLLTTDTSESNWWLFGVRFGDLFFDFSSTRRTGPAVETGKDLFVAVTASSTPGAFPPTARHQISVWDGTTWTHEYGTEYMDLRMLGLEIGSFNSGQRAFEGNLDDLRIYDETLNQMDLVSLALGVEPGVDLVGQITGPEGLTNAQTLEFNVVFSEEVQGLDASDFLITTGPLLVHGTPQLSGSGAEYTLSLGVQGDGPLNVDLIPGSGVQALDGTPLAAQQGSADITLDQTPPSVTSAVLLNTNPTTNDDVRFELTFSEPLDSFQSDDFIINTTGGVTTTGKIFGPTLQPLTTTRVGALGVDGDGTLSFTLPGTGGAPTDAAGNELLSFTTIIVNHINDDAPPSVVSIVPDTQSPSGRSVNFTVVFDEAVKGFGVNDFITATGSGFSRHNSGGVETSDHVTYTYISSVDVSDGVTAATVFEQVNAVGVTDLAGNPITGPGPVSAPVTFPADPYQLWAIASGLTAGSNFDAADDPDQDGEDNASEFLRNNDPLSANDPVKRRAHVAVSGGLEYGTITVAAPDDLEYILFSDLGDGPPFPIPDGMYGEMADLANREVIDFIWSSQDLEEFGMMVPDLVEDETISTPLGMPALDAGWSYRHFRLTEPVDQVPSHFFQVLSFPDGDEFFFFLIGDDL